MGTSRLGRMWPTMSPVSMSPQSPQSHCPQCPQSPDIPVSLMSQYPRVPNVPNILQCPRCPHCPRCPQRPRCPRVPRRRPRPRRSGCSGPGSRWCSSGICWCGDRTSCSCCEGTSRGHRHPPPCPLPVPPAPVSGTLRGGSASPGDTSLSPLSPFLSPRVTPRAQERDLERRFELLSRELRGLLGTEEWQKPPAQREREQLLLEELVALVNRRDRLVRDRHRRESRALEEDEELRRSLEPRRRRFGRRETCGIC
uniref:Uncharacterized protein n=1 Tax=Geospiza parvula TaxID=87175 RepID=A0A8U8B3U4_GEOPR